MIFIIMKKRILIFKVVLLLFCFSFCNRNRYAGQSSPVSDTLTYINPIINKYLADPCIVFDNGYYYLFATGGAEDGRFIPIHRTKNLRDWEFVRGAVQRGEKTSWNYKHFWAPEVIKINGLYHLYYTASPEYSPRNSGNRVGLAIAKSIEGPYEDVGIVIPHASIDGHPFKDKDGSLYIYYTIEHLNSDSLVAGRIYMDKLLSPQKVQGKPTPIITHHPWQEGPFLQYRYNKYFLTYSCGNWMDSTYHLRYAISNSPAGPFIEQPDTLLKSNAMVKGPGHHFMFTNADGKDWIVYHGWDTAYKARYPRIDRIFFTENKIASDGPTYTIQRVKK